MATYMNKLEYNCSANRMFLNNELIQTFCGKQGLRHD